MKNETKLVIVLVTTIMLVVGIGFSFWIYPTITTYEAVKVPAITEMVQEPPIAVAGKIIAGWAGYVLLIMLAAGVVKEMVEW